MTKKTLLVLVAACVAALLSPNAITADPPCPFCTVGLCTVNWEWEYTCTQLLPNCACNESYDPPRCKPGFNEFLGSQMFPYSLSVDPQDPQNCTSGNCGWCTVLETLECGRFYKCLNANMEDECGYFLPCAWRAVSGPFYLGAYWWAGGPCCGVPE